jgi:hypothetical protein
MNAPTVDIKDLLIADSSLGLTLGGNLFIGKMPSQPRRTVTLFDSYGFAPQLALANQGYEYPAIQIQVRDVDYQNAYDVCEEIKTLLHGVNHTTLNGALYTVIYCSSGPTLLEWDDNGNVLFVMNFNLQRRAV